MAGVCSAHFGDVPVAGCGPCHTTPGDLFPNWDEKVAEAEAKGEHTCAKCQFVFYLTVDTCPLCEHKIGEPLGFNIPKDKDYPPDAVQCNTCGGWGCRTCQNRGWLPAGSPLGRLCAYERCKKPLTSAHVAIYCTNRCAALDAYV
jgi:hypothetical protein